MAYGAILGQKPPMPSIENIYQIGDIVPSLNSDMGTNFVPCDGRHINSADGTDVLKGKLEPRVVIAENRLFSNDCGIFQWGNEIYLLSKEIEYNEVGNKYEVLKSYKNTTGDIYGEFTLIGNINNKVGGFSLKTFGDCQGMFKEGQYYYLPVNYHGSPSPMCGVVKTKDFINFEEEYRFVGSNDFIVTLYKHPAYNKVVFSCTQNSSSNNYPTLVIESIFSNGKTNLSGSMGETIYTTGRVIYLFNYDKDNTPLFNIISMRKNSENYFYLQKHILNNNKVEIPNNLGVYSKDKWNSDYHKLFAFSTAKNYVNIVFSGYTGASDVTGLLELSSGTFTSDKIEFPINQMNVVSCIPNPKNNDSYWFFEISHNENFLMWKKKRDRSLLVGKENHPIFIGSNFKNSMFLSIKEETISYYGHYTDGSALVIFVSDEYLPDLNSDSDSVKYFIKIK